MTAVIDRWLMLCAGLLLAPLPALADSEAIDWLEGMNQAMHGLDYEGRFVYRHGNTIEAMYLAHTVRDGKEREHLVSLTGNAREIIRDNNSVICITAGSKAPKVEKRAANSRFSPILRIDLASVSSHYRFAFGSDERIAGRAARVLNITPRDGLRYGYRLMLDMESRLPLGAATFDQTGQTMSQVLFTELKIGEDVSAPPPGVARQGEVSRTVIPRHAPSQPQAPRWSFDDIPAGFKQTLHRRRLVGNDEHEMTHFVFSDGLASVSVYVEESQPAEGLEGASRMGAVNAFGRRVGDYHVTAVGEVPTATLAHFVAGIQSVVGAP